LNHNNFFKTAQLILYKQKLFIESITFFLIFIFLFILSVLNIKFNLFKFITFDPFWVERSITISGLGITYSLIFLIIAIYTFNLNYKKFSVFIILYKSSKSTICIFYNKFKKLINIKKTDLGLLLAILLGVFTTSHFLTQPIRQDEASTFFSYIHKGFPYFFIYDRPNNHVLHSILSAMSTSIFGFNLVAIRLTAFISGILCIPTTYLICKRIFHKKSGLLASYLLAVSPVFILYSTMARGYTLITLFTLLLILSVHSYLNTKSKIYLIVTSFVASLGIFTIPVMIFPISGIYLYITLRKILNNESLYKIFKECLVPLVFFTSFFTFLFYTPVLFFTNDIDLIINNSIIKSQPFDIFITSLDSHLISVVDNLFRKSLPLWIKYSIWFLIIISIVFLIAERKYNKLLLIISIIIGIIIILFLKRKVPYARIYLFLLPLIFIYADLGFTLIMRLFTRSIRLVVMSIITIFFLLFSIHLSINYNISEERDTGIAPDSKQIAKMLIPYIKSGDKIIGTKLVTQSIRFYIKLYGIQYLPHIYAKRTDKSIHHHFYIVSKDYKESMKKITKFGTWNDYRKYRKDYTELELEKLRNKKGFMSKQNQFYIINKYYKESIQDFTKESVNKLIEYGDLEVYTDY